MDTANYSKEIGKLNRIAGQIEAIKDMINCKRAATEIMIQLRAVRGSVKSIESIILEDHLTRHLLNAQDSTDLAERIKATSKLFKKSDL